MSGKKHQQAVVRFIAVTENEFLDTFFEGSAGGVEQGGDVKALLAQRGTELMHFLGDALQVRPAGGVVADSDQQGIAFLVSGNQATVFRQNRCGRRPPGRFTATDPAAGGVRLGRSRGGSGVAPPRGDPSDE